MKPEQKGYLELILFAVTTGTIGVFTKMISDMNEFTILFFRAIIAVVFIFLVVLFTKRLNELPIKQPLRTFLVGFFQGLAIIFYFLSVFRTAVTNTAFLLYSAPIWTIILAKILLKEKIEKKTIIGMIITVLGIILILNPESFSFSSKETLGNVFGLFSGIFYAAMAVTAKPLTQKVSGYYAAFWQYMVIAIIFVFLINSSSVSAVPMNWWKLIIIGVLCTGVAYILFMNGIRKVKAQKVFIITSIEPLTGAIFAFLLLKELPSLITVAGALLILMGIYLVAKKQNN